MPVGRFIFCPVGSSDPAYDFHGELKFALIRASPHELVTALLVTELTVQHEVLSNLLFLAMRLKKG